MKSVLGVDLGASWQTTGSAVLWFDDVGWISYVAGPIAWPNSPCGAEAIADAIADFALKNNIYAVSLDGPQGWRDPTSSNGFVGRDCERLTRTPGKTGTFGISIPRTWTRWIQCSIRVFDRLLGAHRAVLVNTPEADVLTDPPPGKFYLLECFPTSTWRQAGLAPLPGHGIEPSSIHRFAADLRACFGLPDTPSRGSGDQLQHDDLQALVAALPAAGLLGAPCRSVPKGLPARMIAAQDGIPPHRGEGIIWDAMPSPRLRRLNTRREPDPIAPVSLRPQIEATECRGIFVLGAEGVERGVRLFMYFVEASNRGDAVGISYGAFIAYLHGVAEFRNVAGRSFLPSDSMAAVRLAWRITEAAGGRKQICRSSAVIEAGMDTFIWNAKWPFERPDRAWQYPIPYSRHQRLSIFPDGLRRMITMEELEVVGRGH